jgi:hypothetical protein
VLLAIIFFQTHYFDWNVDVYRNVAQIAIEKNNPKICSKIWTFWLYEMASDAAPVESHRQSCYEMVAIALKDISICEKYVESDGYCVFEIEKALRQSR